MRPTPARVLLIVSSVVILAATLLPSEPAGEVDWNAVLCLLCSRASLADALANIMLFLPLGLVLRLEISAPWRALAYAASLSLFVECAQFAVPGRDPSLGDFISNALGSALGGQLSNAAGRWISPAPRVASRLSLAAALMAGGAFVLTGALLTTSLPHGTYYSGSMLLQASTKPLRLGGSTDPRESFQGRIDDVRIYDRARTPAEIRGDMDAPMAVAPFPRGLVAAYTFDNGPGTVLRDVSGHGNHGHIEGATWTSQGRFGAALDFDGGGDAVVVPHGPSLELTQAMTLEAWIYPTTVQTGWRPIVQKEFDAYFLLASSRTGAFRPGGGGTFGSATEIVKAPAVLPVNAWTHVAVTYDGAMLEFYVNGAAVARRLRWYPGRVLAATLDGLAVPAGATVESRSLRERLLSGAPLRVRAVAAAPVPGRAPLFTLHDQFRNEILLLAAEGDDVLFRLRTRAAAAELDRPAIRARGALRGLAPGDDVALTVSRAGRAYCLEVNTRSTCGLGFTLGMGWSLLLYSQVPPGWPHAVLNVLWMAALLFPVGFWLRRRWESLLGLLVLAAGIVLPCTIGSSSVSCAEIGAAIVGILAGWACAQVARAMDRTVTRPRAAAGSREP